MILKMGLSFFVNIKLLMPIGIKNNSVILVLLLKSMKNYNLNFYFVNGFYILLFIVFSFGKSFSQCPLTTSAGTYAATNGTTFVNYSGYSPGTYLQIPILSGGSYALSTCGATIDTRITGWNAAATSTLFYNDDNGTLCSGTAASIDNFVPILTEFAKVQISEANCLPGGSSSINLLIRQNNNLSFTSSQNALCAGQTRTLAALPASVTVTSALFGNPGTFSGTSVSGNIFTAPPVIAPTIFTVTYSFGFVSQTQTLLVNPSPSVTAVTTKSAVCSGSTIILTGAGATNYTWSAGVINSVPFTPTATTTYSVIGTDSVTGCIASNTAVITVTVEQLPIVNVVSTKSLLCSGESCTLIASGSAISYTWNNASVGTFIAVSPTITTTYNVFSSGLNGCKNSTAYTQSVSICENLIEFKSAKINSIKIYPNPSRGSFVVSSNHNTSIVIINSLGQIVETYTLNEENNKKVDVHLINRGVYLIIDQDSETSNRFKLIVSD